MGNITSFTDLIVWQRGHKFVLEIYNITDKFPKTESFGLTSQLRRAAVSVTSNICEGFERKSGKEFEQFLCISRGSLAETQNQLLIARDLGYVNTIMFNKIAMQTVEIHKLLNAFIKSVNTKNKTKDSRLATTN